MRRENKQGRERQEFQSEQIFQLDAPAISKACPEGFFPFHLFNSHVQGAMRCSCTLRGHRGDKLLQAALVAAS